MIRDTSGQDQQVTVNKRSNIKIGLLGAALFLGVAVSANAVINSESPTLSLSKSSLNIATVTSGNFVRDIAATGFIVAANAPQAYMEIAMEFPWDFHGNFHGAVKRRIHLQHFLDLCLPLCVLYYEPASPNKEKFMTPLCLTLWELSV